MNIKNDFYWTRLECSKLEWAFLPLAIYLCKQPKKEEKLNTKLLDDIFFNKKILILTSDVGQLNTNNCLNLMVRNFQGKNGDLVEQIFSKNNIEIPFKVERINPMYGSLDEYFIELKNKILKHQPSIVILMSEIKIDSNFIEKESLVSKLEVEQFYQNFKDLIESHNLKKIISKKRIFDILDENDLKTFFWNEIKDICEIYLDHIRRFENKASCSLISRINNKNTNELVKIKMTIGHDGQIFQKD